MNTKAMKKGFTLIELLVVIAIIAVLAGVIALAIDPVSLLQKSRDARRLQDLDTINKALNLALAEQAITLVATVTGGSNCGDCVTNRATNTATVAAVDGTGWVNFTVGSLGAYLGALPLDPTNDATYYYEFASTATGYELNAQFEHLSNTGRYSVDGGDSATRYEIGTLLTVIQ